MKIITNQYFKPSNWHFKFSKCLTRVCVAYLISLLKLSSSTRSEQKHQAFPIPIWPRPSLQIIFQMFIWCGNIYTNFVINFKAYFFYHSEKIKVLFILQSTLIGLQMCTCVFSGNTSLFCSLNQGISGNQSNL